MKIEKDNLIEKIKSEMKLPKESLISNFSTLFNSNYQYKDDSSSSSFDNDDHYNKENKNDQSKRKFKKRILDFEVEIGNYDKKCIDNKIKCECNKVDNESINSQTSSLSSPLKKTNKTIKSKKNNIKIKKRNNGKRTTWRHDEQICFLSCYIYLIKNHKLSEKKEKLKKSRYNKSMREFIEYIPNKTLIQVNSHLQKLKKNNSLQKFCKFYKKHYKNTIKLTQKQLNNGGISFFSDKNEVNKELSFIKSNLTNKDFQKSYIEYINKSNSKKNTNLYKNILSLNINYPVYKSLIDITKYPINYKSSNQSINSNTQSNFFQITINMKDTPYFENDNKEINRNIKSYLTKENKKKGNLNSYKRIKEIENCINSSKQVNCNNNLFTFQSYIEKYLNIYKLTSSVNNSRLSYIKELSNVNQKGLNVINNYKLEHEVYKENQNEVQKLYPDKSNNNKYIQNKEYLHSINMNLLNQNSSLSKVNTNIDQKNVNFSLIKNYSYQIKEKYHNNKSEIDSYNKNHFQNFINEEILLNSNSSYKINEDNFISFQNIDYMDNMDVLNYNDNKDNQNREIIENKANFEELYISKFNNNSNINNLSNNQNNDNFEFPNERFNSRLSKQSYIINNHYISNQMCSPFHKNSQFFENNFSNQKRKMKKDENQTILFNTLINNKRNNEGLSSMSSYNLRSKIICFNEKERVFEKKEIFPERKHNFDNCGIFNNEFSNNKNTFNKTKNLNRKRKFLYENASINSDCNFDSIHR